MSTHILTKRLHITCACKFHSEIMHGGVSTDPQLLSYMYMYRSCTLRYLTLSNAHRCTSHLQLEGGGIIYTCMCLLHKQIAYLYSNNIHGEQR